MFRLIKWKKQVEEKCRIVLASAVHKVSVPLHHQQYTLVIDNNGYLLD